MMSTLIVIPTQKEVTSFIQACADLGISFTNEMIGRLSCARSEDVELTIACGGLGKAQFGITTQHLIDCGSRWDLVICTGAAGGLSDSLSIGDIVVGNETVEYDFIKQFGAPVLPRFPATADALQKYQMIATRERWPFDIYFSTIASGDQDVVDEPVRSDISSRTQAMVVAWEGAGGARACVFNEVPFIEIRCVSDAANSSAASDFRSNLGTVMGNLASYITADCG